jgi:spermidine/putrescine-binding protein
MNCQSRSITRRSFMLEMAVSAGATAVSPMLAVPAAYAADKITLTICSYGGVYQESQDKAYFKPYQEEHPNIVIAQ